MTPTETTKKSQGTVEAIPSQPIAEPATTSLNVDRFDVSLYPNPTDRVLNLNVADLMGKSGVIRIFNTQGSLVGMRTYQDLAQSTLQLELDNYVNGLYFINIQIDGSKQSITKKFMVRKN